MRKITDITQAVRCVTVSNDASTALASPNVYFIAKNNQAVFIDSAYGKRDEIEAILDCWKSHGKPNIAGIILTHRHKDHIGGSIELAKVTGGKLICSTLEKNSIEQSLKGYKIEKLVPPSGEMLTLDGITLKLIHTPGHTNGSLCVYYTEQNILFTGDTILSTGSTSISPEHGDMTQYIDSLQNLLKYESQIICPGHGPIITSTRFAIEKLIERRMFRENQILELIQKEPRTINDIFDNIYSNLDEILHNTARNQILSHLLKLERDGRIKQINRGIFKLI